MAVQLDTLARMEAAAPRIKNGTFTITFRNGDHRTLKVHTVKAGPLAGKRLLSLLTGPDNTSDYTAFAFVDDDRVTVWKKFRAALASFGTFRGYEWEKSSHKGGYWTRWQKAAAIFTDLVLRERGYWTSEGCTLLVEGRCCVCNRKLTTPDSIRLGIGPVCAGR